MRLLTLAVMDSIHAPSHAWNKARRESLTLPWSPGPTHSAKQRLAKTSNGGDA